MSDKWLSTREAARYLQVSEASIRRWTDAGLLPAGRVGVRKVRRFKEADLAQFMGVRHRPSTAAESAATITLVGKPVAVGSHLAGFYSTEAGRFRQALPMLLDGLSGDQPCVLFAPPEVHRRYLRALREEQIDLKAAVRDDSWFSIAVTPMTPEVFIARLETLLSEILRRRPGPVRFIAEVTAGLKTTGSRKALLDQERMLTSVVKRYPVVLLCLYDVREFDGPTILEALKLHHEMFVYGLGYFLD